MFLSHERRRYWLSAVALLLCMFLPIRASAKDSSGSFTKGTVYLQQGNLAQAIKAFTKAIQINPLYVEAYNNRALAYYGQKNNDKAEADFLKALEIDPDNEIANSNLGILYLEKGDCAAALRYLENATRTATAWKPYHAVIFRNLAFVYAKTGKIQEAEASLKRALMIERDLTGTIPGLPDPNIIRPWEEKQDHILVLEVWQRR